MKKTFKLSELTKIAHELIAAFTSKTICFYGDMGAGKTTLIKAIVKELGGGDDVNSPTFSIVNEYHGEKGTLGYHFDFYRLNDEFEALDLGFEEYLDHGKWIFIEWPEKITSLLPDDRNDIQLTVIDSDTREITLKVF